MSKHIKKAQIEPLYNALRAGSFAGFQESEWAGVVSQVEAVDKGVAGDFAAASLDGVNAQVARLRAAAIELSLPEFTKHVNELLGEDKHQASGPAELPGPGAFLAAAGIVGIAVVLLSDDAQSAIADFMWDIGIRM